MNEKKPAPERIYLQDGCTDVECEQVGCRSYEEVTWCEDQIHDNDTAYVRAPPAPSTGLGERALREIDTDHAAYLVDKMLDVIATARSDGDPWGTIHMLREMLRDTEKVLLGVDLRAAPRPTPDAAPTLEGLRELLAAAAAVLDVSILYGGAPEYRRLGAAAAALRVAPGSEPREGGKDA